MTGAEITMMVLDVLILVLMVFILGGSLYNWRWSRLHLRILQGKLTAKDRKYLEKIK